MNQLTWVVKLWIDNDEGSYNFWRERAEDYSSHGDTGDGGDAVPCLADELKQSHSEALPELNGFAADLINAAMSEVNWYEIVESMINDWKADHETPDAA